MCEVCGVTNSAKVFIFNDSYIVDYCNSILKGDITPTNLSEDLHIKTAEALSSAVEYGFGVKLDSLVEGSKEYNKLDGLISSCYIFSAHKQHSFVVHALAEIENSDDKLKVLTDLFKRYYIDYLSTEVDSAEWQARGAKSFGEQIEWNG